MTAPALAPALADTLAPGADAAVWPLAPAASAGGVQVFAAIAAPDGSATVWARSDAAAGPTLATGDGASILDQRSFLHGTRARIAPAGTVLRLRADGAAGLAIPVIAPDLTTFADRAVLLIHANGEGPDALATGLAHHAAGHGADAALVIARTAAEAAALVAVPLPAGFRLRVLAPAVPLGLPGQPAERDPLLAPDAPGRDRMTAGPDDGWHAPLGWVLAHDLAVARWLGAARAVASIEAHDLIIADTPALAAAATAPSGVRALAGPRAYPWVVAGPAPVHGDHVCRRFDAGPPRAHGYVAVPARVPAGAVWLGHRILGMRPPARVPPLEIVRCMALRHGRAGGPPIAPRSGLIEDPALLALAAGLGHRPRRMLALLPAAAADLRQLPVKDPGGHRTTIVTTMKNEGPFILEWVAWHRAMGVTDIVVYTNECSDGTDALLDALAARGLLTRRDNPYRGTAMKPQHAALEAAHAEPAVRDADWLICMDVDEFIVVHAGDHTLAALRAAVPDANMIALTWRLFGSSGLIRHHDRPVTQQFVHAARETANKPHQAWGFKTLFRNQGLWRKLGVHRPKGLRPHAHRGVAWVNGSGVPLPPDQWRTAWRSHAGTVGYDLASLHHYAVRSVDSFLVKRDRGRVNHVDRDQGLAYWFRMNHNVVADDRATRYAPALLADLPALLADPVIGAAHRACVAAHRARIGVLSARPDLAAFRAVLASDRMDRLSRLHGHFGAGVYLAGPTVIPDHVALRAPDEPFFFTVDHDGKAAH